MSGFLLRSDLYQPLTGTFNKCSANGPPRPAPASVDHAAARQEGRPWAAHTTAYGTRAGNYWSPVPFTFLLRSDLYQPLTGTFNKCSSNGPPRPAPASVDHAAARQEGRHGPPM